MVYNKHQEMKYSQLFGVMIVGTSIRDKETDFDEKVSWAGLQDGINFL